MGRSSPLMHPPLAIVLQMASGMSPNIDDGVVQFSNGILWQWTIDIFEMYFDTEILIPYTRTHCISFLHIALKPFLGFGFGYANLG